MKSNSLRCLKSCHDQKAREKSADDKKSCIVLETWDKVSQDTVITICSCTFWIQVKNSLPRLDIFEILNVTSILPSIYFTTVSFQHTNVVLKWPYLIVSSIMVTYVPTQTSDKDVPFFGITSTCFCIYICKTIGWQYTQILDKDTDIAEFSWELTDKQGSSLTLTDMSLEKNKIVLRTEDALLQGGVRLFLETQRRLEACLLLAIIKQLLLEKDNYVLTQQLLDKERIIKELEDKNSEGKCKHYEAVQKQIVLDERISELNYQLLEKDKIIKIMEEDSLKKIREIQEQKHVLENKVLNLEDKVRKMEKQYEDLLFDHGRIIVERESKLTRAKKNEEFHRIFSSRSISASNEIGASPEQPSCCSVEVQKSPNYVEPITHINENSCSNRAEISNPSSHVEGTDVQNVSTPANIPPEDLQFSVEVQEQTHFSLTTPNYEHPSSVTAHVHNMYKLLLLTVGKMLTQSDTARLQRWAVEKGSVNVHVNVTKLLFQLDQTGTISVSDLSVLRTFFESIVRHDLVYLIDKFNSGDYDDLKRLMKQNKWTAGNGALRSRSNRFTRRPVDACNQDVRNGEISDLPNATGERTTLHLNSQRDEFSASGHSSRRNFVANHGRLSNQVEGNVHRAGPVNHTRGNQCDVKVVRTRTSPVATEKADATEVLKLSQPPSSHNHVNQNPTASNTQCHLHNQSDNGSEANKQDKWLCSHYKRRCWVKFACCDQYWPCHRCHNSESTCGRKKLKSLDTTMVKCAECGKEQQFGENSEFCVSCNTQFAIYFCGICKHLTGMDDHPYHCEKCGICRIHGDRSFHCDVCGICLDVQLRGNHKCRPDSAHDECCICLEDAFTGCQILPCSHKVHKDCATQMIRRGITRCPVCRESFAHKLERRPLPTKTRRKR